MSMRIVCRLLGVALASIMALGLAGPAAAQPKIKIGVIFDLTGPLAGGGSELHYLGVKIMVDYFVKKGGVEGYQIEAIYADAQSKPEVAINEAVRLIEQEKVDMVMGFFSSAQCVPVAARVEQLKKFMFITTCISSAVLENRNLKYVFRAQPSGSQFGELSMDFVAQNAKEKLGKDPKDVRVAIIHEDGAYGVDVAKGNEAGAKRAGLNLVAKEGYSATAPDLSALVTKLKRARPDVIFHTGYNPDITLLLRQAREQGLKFGALVGHGAGYGVYEKLKEGLGGDVNYFFNADPISIWLSNQKTLDPKLPAVIKMVGEEFDKVKPGVAIRSAHVGMAASNTYLFLTDVLPRAIKKYGGIDAEALRKAALDVDIPEGGTMLGFGVKFEGEGQPMADGLLLLGVNVLLVAQVGDDGLAGVFQLQGQRLGFAQLGPVALLDRLDLHERRELDEEEREVALLPVVTPVLDHQAHQVGVEVGPARVRFALVPDRAAHGVRHERGDHGVVKRARRIGVLSRIALHQGPARRGLALFLGLRGIFFPFLQSRFVSGLGLLRIELLDRARQAFVIVLEGGHGVERFLAGPSLGRRAAPRGEDKADGNIEGLLQIAAEKIADSREVTHRLGIAFQPAGRLERLLRLAGGRILHCKETDVGIG
jgi:branched-chain amino acid transport system substrate-binding protein